MAWARRESHHVGSYVFHWFTDGQGAWLVAIWPEDRAPRSATERHLRSALTIHYVSPRDNPKGKLKPVRQFCQRFVEDIPFRVRAIRDKVPTLRALEKRGVLSSENEATGKG